jgi:capsule biosynthesis phosphatase
MIMDCDSIYSEDVILKYKNSSFKNAIFCFLDFQKAAIYSYSKIFEGKVIDVKEKEKISNYANSGIYCFENGNVLKKYCTKIIKNGKRQKNEFYISGVYKEMIRDKLVIEAIIIEKNICVGTPNQLKSYLPANIEKMRICFDLDNTLVTYPTIDKDYYSVEPIQEVIDYVKFLKSQGHTIIIHTARRMATHNNNLGAVIADIGKCTIETLEKFEIPYDELIFGKPIADFYFDDKSVDPKLDFEKQIGIYNTEIKPRDFNTIEIKKNTIIKSGKIVGEKFWYQNVPEEISNLFPKLIDSGNRFIELERIKGVPLSYLYINGSLTEEIFRKFLSSLSKIHSVEVSEKIDIYLNYKDKIYRRYDVQAYSEFKDHEFYYKKFVSFFKDYEDKKLGMQTVIHGDPVFTNVIIDVDNNVKMIDMRGLVGDNKTIYGDIYYDLAKVYQSIIGYDFILNSKRPNSTQIDLYKNIFKDHVIQNYGLDKFEIIKLICCSHLFSLLPLHSDQKKKQQYYNLMVKEMKSSALLLKIV